LIRIFEELEKTKPDWWVINYQRGGAIDLDCFDDIRLAIRNARNSASGNTGIGAERDETIADPDRAHPCKLQQQLLNFILASF